jgi:hypothetical protein
MTQEVYSDKQYEDFISKIDELGKRDHIEILRIIKEDDNSLKITENNNGCFINLNELEQSTLENVNNFLNYIEDNKKELNKHETIKSELKDNYLS